jgi:hypothetical protein
MTFLIGALVLLLAIMIALVFIAVIMTVLYVFISNDSLEGLLVLLVIGILIFCFADPIGQAVRPWLSEVLR